MRAVIIPIDVTRGTVEGILRGLMPISLITSVTVPGYEDAEKPIVNGLKELAMLIGAKYFHIMVAPGDVMGFMKILSIFDQYRPREVYLVSITGSRYLLPPLITVLLKYWRDTGNHVYILQGIEQDKKTLSIQPLPGFFATAMRISKVQKRILEIVYGSDETISGKDLKEKYGFTHSIYSVLRDMERKGLLIVRRGRIEKTFPGRLVYALMKLDSKGRSK